MTPAYEIKGLNIAKFFCIFFIVMIHTSDELLALFTPLCRMAVPVFLMITGYFLPDDECIIQENRLKRMIKKLFIILIIANSFYLLVDFAINQPHIKNFIKYHIHHGKERDLLFWTPTEAPLWYLGAVVQALIILWIAIRINKLKWCFAIALAGLVGGMAIGVYHPLFGLEATSLYYSRNALTVGLPALMVGILIRKYENRLPSHRFRIAIFSVVLGLSYLEIILLGDKIGYGDIFIMTLPLGASAFALALIPNVSSIVGNTLAAIGRKYSLYIYVLHPFVAKHIQAPLSLNGMNYLCLPMVFILCLLISILVVHSIKAIKSLRLQLSR